MMVCLKDYKIQLNSSAFHLTDGDTVALHLQTIEPNLRVVTEVHQPKPVCFVQTQLAWTQTFLLSISCDWSLRAARFR